MYSIEFEVPLLFTDPNRLSGRAWRTRHSRYEHVKRFISLAVGKNKPKKPLKKFQIAFIRKGPGYLDWDNLVASLKPYIDGLTIAGVIQDDGWSFIRHIDVDQEKSEEEKILIKVKEIVKVTRSNGKDVKV